MHEQIILEEESIAEERAVDAARLGTAITNRPIRKLPTLREPMCVPPDATVRDAIDAMNEHRTGCVLVVDDGRLVGVFTERDVLTKIAAQGTDHDATDARYRRLHRRPVPRGGAEPPAVAGARHRAGTRRGLRFP
jgi:CBS domain-containing protein